MKNRIRRILAVAAAVIALTAVAVPSLPSGVVLAKERPYVFTTIDPVGSTATIAYGMNAKGDIVGKFNEAGGPPHGFLLSRGVFSTLDYPGDDVAWTQATAIGPRGDIVGFYSLKVSASPGTLAGNIHGFLRTKKGEWSTVDYPEGTHIMQGGLYRILPDGTMLGCFHDGYPTMTEMHGYIVNPDGTIESFDYPADKPFAMFYGGTPNGKTIIGMDLVGTTTSGFVLNRKSGDVTSFMVPGSVMTQAFDINPAGVIVGIYGNPVQGFVAETHRSTDPADWKFTTISYPGATLTRVRGINAAGDLVGDYIDANNTAHGFLASRSERHDGDGHDEDGGHDGDDRDGDDRHDRHGGDEED